MNEIDDKYARMFQDKSDKNLPKLDYKQEQSQNLEQQRNKALTEYRTKTSMSVFTAPQNTESYLYTHNSFLFKEDENFQFTPTGSSTTGLKFQKSYSFRIFFCIKLRKKNSPKKFLELTLFNHIVCFFMHFTLFLLSLCTFQYQKLTKTQKNDEDFHLFLILPFSVNFLTFVFLLGGKESLKKLRSKKHLKRVKNSVLLAFIINGFNIFSCVVLMFVYLIFFRSGNVMYNMGIIVDVGFLFVPFLFSMWNISFFLLCKDVFPAVDEIGMIERGRRGRVLED